jgi:hypothetical protein
MSRGKRQPHARLCEFPVELLESRQLLSGSVMSPFDTSASPVAAVSIDATAGKRFKDVVATWTNPGGLPTKASGTAAVAIVNWGDGKSTHAKLLDDGSGVIQIVGTHTWAKPGTFQTSVSVEEFPKGHPRQITDIGQGAGAAVVAPKPHNVSLKGTLSGTYTTPITNPDARSYDFTGTGSAGALGAVSVDGSISPPGFIKSAPATGEFTLTGADGTVTFDVKGHNQAGGSPLPEKLAYTVTGGTGAFANAGGKGTISVALDTTANTFVIVIH